MNQKQSRAAVYEMLRSFAVMGTSLNLCETAEQLQTTRQTVRRHIHILEEIKGVKLFELRNRQYHLTKDGKRCMEDAATMLNRADAWLNGTEENFGGLSKVVVEEDGGYVFYSQQHPLYRIWQDSPPLLQRGLDAWCASRGHLEHSAMKRIRPYLVVYRKTLDTWINVSIGEKSAIAQWLGWVWAKSTIGCPLTADPMRSSADRHVIATYEEVVRNGSVRLDHAHTKVPREEGGTPEPVTYQRLLFCGIFPDGETAVAMLSAITNSVDIEALDVSRTMRVPDDQIMDFDPE